MIALRVDNSYFSLTMTSMQDFGPSDLKACLLPIVVVISYPHKPCGEQNVIK